MGFDALSIGREETTETGQRPATRSAVNWTMRGLRTAFLGAACAFPSSAAPEAADTPTVSVAAPSRDVKLDIVEQELRRVWADMRTYLLQKGADMEREYVAQLDTLREKKLPGNVTQLEKSWERILTKAFNRENGGDHTTIDGNLRCYADLEKLLERNRWLMPEKDTGIDQALIDEASFASLNTWRLNVEERYREALMTDETGRRLGLYLEEFAKDPTLTPEKYIEQLAERLKTPHRLAMFLRFYFYYTFDSDDVNQPLKKGTRDRHFDHDQTVEETLKRTEHGQMLGDCEDVCEFCEPVLKKMGIRAAIVYITGKPASHCTCVWLMQHNGKYVAGDIGTLGYYLDDQLIDPFDFSFTPEPRTLPLPNGQETKEEAMKAGLQHLEGLEGLSLSDWNAGQILMKKDRSEWSKFQPWEARWQKLTMAEFTAKLLEPVTPEPVITADTPGPPLE